MQILRLKTSIFPIIIIIILVAFFLLEKNNSKTNNFSDIIKGESSWSKLLKNEGPEKAYAEFKKLYMQKPFSESHLASHVFGKILYEQQKEKGIITCDSSFAFGCYHGFFTQAIAQNGLSIVESLDSECVKKFGQRNSSPCKHGMGHGIVEYLGHDKKQLVKALISCETNHEEINNERFFGCFSGVFMEYNHPILITAEAAEMGIRELNADNPYEPCNSIPDRFKTSCFHQIGQWWEKVYDYNYSKIGKLCNTIQNAEYRTVCFRGLGNVIGPSTDYKPSEIIARCEKMPTREGMVFCISSAAWTVDQQAGDKTLARETCSNLSAEEKKQFCP